MAAVHHISLHPHEAIDKVRARCQAAAIHRDRLRDRPEDAGATAAKRSLFGFSVPNFGGLFGGVPPVLTGATVTLHDYNYSVDLGTADGPATLVESAAERIEVAYDLSTPWSGNGFALNTRAVRLWRSFGFIIVGVFLVARS